jgi:hypothetical protein
MRRAVRSCLAGAVIAWSGSGPGLTACRAQGYMPSGGGFGGFVPYRAGPGGGLGVQSRTAEPAGRGAQTGAVMSGGMRPTLGAPRGTITPLRPLGVIGSGGGMLGMPRAPTARPGMTRPSVGSYPFRIPPSLVNPGGGPATSM